jgi:hypothetical protein
MDDKRDQVQPIDLASLGYIKCDGGWRHPACPEEPPFAEDELRRHLEIAAKLPTPSRKARRR